MYVGAINFMYENLILYETSNEPKQTVLIGIVHSDTFSVN